MNKQEMITAVSIKGDMSKKDATLAIETVFEVIEDSVSVGDSVNIIGFGKFEKQFVKGREGVSKLRGTEVPWKTDDSFKPVFSCGKNFLDKCN